MADPEFTFGMFPAMSQVMSGGGVSLMTLWQKLGTGTRLTRTSANAWKELGLLPHGLLQGAARPGAMADSMRRRRSTSARSSGTSS
jgi:hypothetical protein